ncbi:MAG: LysM peptidoglycan-binding domain-containing protein [Cyclobacteriaceae bacterium]|nr:LysM peptidoglycan-binding domain-containing protein [Cyclobacteriaceae bacterium]
MKINFFIICLLHLFTIRAKGTPVVTKEVDFGNMKLVLSRNVIAEIQQQVNSLTSSPKYYQMKVDRMLLYFPVIERVFKEEGVPEDFKYLAIQESGLVSDAVSSADAVGFWQFKDFTAREVGLRVDKQIDERKNIVASSRGAATYLKRHNFLVDNWVYAMSAYQAGMGGARKYMNKSNYGARKLEINSSTHWYVKKFIAHKIAFQDRINDKHSQNLSLIEFKKGANKNLNWIAKEFELDVDLIKTYNKWIRTGEIPEDKTYVVLIPTQQKVKNKTLSEVVVENESKPAVERTNIEKKIYPFEMVPGLSEVNSKNLKFNNLKVILSGNSNNLNSLAAEAGISIKLLIKYNDLNPQDPIKANTIYYLESKKSKSQIGFHVVENSETLWSISQKYALRLNKLKTMNRITSNEKIEIDRVLYLNAKRPKNTPIQYHKKEQKKEMNAATIDIEEQPEKSDKIIPTSTTVKNKIPTAKKIHTVVEGESLWSLAQKYNVSVKDLRTFNEINENDALNIGQELYIFSARKGLPKASKSNIYTVQAGDSFYSIAVKHNVTVKYLMQLNRRTNDVVMIGDKLKVYPN